MTNSRKSAKQAVADIIDELKVIAGYSGSTNPNAISPEKAAATDGSLGDAAQNDADETDADEAERSDMPTFGILPMTFSFLGACFTWEHADGLEALRLGVSELTDSVLGRLAEFATGRLPASPDLQQAEFAFFGGLVGRRSQWAFAYGNFWNSRDRVLDVAVPVALMTSAPASADDVHQYKAFPADFLVPESEWLRVAKILEAYGMADDSAPRRVILEPQLYGNLTQSGEHWAVKLMPGNPVADWANHAIEVPSHPWLAASPTNPFERIRAGKDPMIISAGDYGGEAAAS